jgi:benzoate/toluate 1,2-dioxygenase subunit beta
MLPDAGHRAVVEFIYREARLADEVSQEPASHMRRLVSHIETAEADNGELVAESNVVLAELAIQAKRELHWWVGRTPHRLRLVGGELEMCRKKVVLVNAAEPLPNLSFLI